jgi:hypothetical protein
MAVPHLSSGRSSLQCLECGHGSREWDREDHEEGREEQDGGQNATATYSLEWTQIEQRLIENSMPVK